MNWWSRIWKNSDVQIDGDEENQQGIRYMTLDAAKKRAQELDCKRAFYPVATISGKECCNLWQHASLQLQTSTGLWS